MSAPPGRRGVFGRRHGRLLLTAALSSVLLALGASTIYGSGHTTLATNQLSEALAVDALFTEARNAITVEEMNVRHYQVEPSVAVRQRFDDASAVVTQSLSQVRTGAAAGDARRLLAEHITYLNMARRLMDLVADQDPARTGVDRLEVTPVFYTLQHDADVVSRSYHAAAERETKDLRRAQIQLLVGTTGGFALAIGLISVIWRMVLGYQRRLVAQAEASAHLALHDALTGLPNRTLFYERVTEALAALPPDGSQTVALMIVDLNEFKAVNDTLGHQAGDELLAEAGRRIRATARDSDVVARLGGDEFAVLLSGVADVATAQAVARRMAQSLRQDFVLTAGPAAVSGSIGLALGPAVGGAGQLVRQADAAMYRAKSTGRDLAVYQPETDTEQPDRMGLFAALRTLLDIGDPTGQLVLYYQPLVRVGDGVVVGLEALVRWWHPERGLLPPGAFLPIVEHRGLEIPLTYHLIGVAAAQAAQWRDDGHPYPVSVNVSPRCLLDDDFAAEIAAILERAGLGPELIRAEITENALMTDPDRALETLLKMHEYGIRISVDDFGTGFSSLSQLKHLPADEVKIDRSFIRDLATDADDAVLVRGTIELAHNLGLTVVAEGVEDLQALEMLRTLGCDRAQGYVLSRPVPAADLLAACQHAQWQASQAQRPTVAGATGQ